jgi:hypothetical protein
MMLHVTGRGFIAQQPHTQRRARNGVTNLGRLGMTVNEAKQLLITGQGTPDQLAQANAVYYGTPATATSPATGGYYGSQPSVIAANPWSGIKAPGDLVTVPPYPGNSETPPQLYPMENCGALDGDCISRNAQREQANMALTHNAEVAYNLAICNYDLALNINATGNTNYPNTCGQYSMVPVPPAPGTPTAPAVSSGGQVLAAIMGNTPSVTPATPAPASTGTAPVSQSQASTITGQPNQSVPPNPSPGTVPSVPVASTAQKLATQTVNGTAPVIDNTTTGDPFGIFTGTLFGMPEWMVLAGGAMAVFLIMRSK